MVYTSHGHSKRKTMISTIVSLDWFRHKVVFYKLEVIVKAMVAIATLTV